MSVALPDYIDPWRAAKNGLAFAGESPLSRFPRLREVGGVDGDENLVPVVYRLDFGHDEVGLPTLDGWVRWRLRLICQRCLDDLWLDLDAPLALVLVRTEPTAKAIEGEREPLVVTNETLDPFELIEDELLLAIPPFPRHPIGECRSPALADEATDIRSVAQHPSSFMAQGAEDEDSASHPFAILERLKKH